MPTEKGAEHLEHQQDHILAVGLRVHQRLSQQDRLLDRLDVELLVEGAWEDLFHVTSFGAVFGRPRFNEHTERGTSSQAKPDLHIPLRLALGK
jgi:hypothetical protein